MPSSRGQPARREEAVAVRDHHHPVGDGPVVGVGPEVLADALDQVGPPRTSGIHRALRVGPHDLDGRVLALQVTADPADRAPRADAGDQMGDAARRLAPDLRPGRQLVGPGIVRVGVLVGHERPRRGLHQAPGDRVVRVRMGGLDGRGAHHHFGTVRPQERHLLVGDLVRHGEHAAVAAPGGHDGEPDPGVTRRRLDDRAAPPELPFLLRRFDHEQRRPVFDAPPGVEHLQLGEQLGRYVPPDAVQAHQRGVTDQPEQRLGGLDRRTRVGQRFHRDPRRNLERLVAVGHDRQAGPVKLAGHVRHVVPAGRGVRPDHAHRSGDVGAQVRHGA